MMVRLLYASRASDTIDDATLSSILERSRSENPVHGITGVLCVCKDNGLFLQALEGAREEINVLYGNLLRDARHTDVTLLLYEEIEERNFSSWRMGRVDIDRVNPGTVLRFSEKADLDPFRMSGRAAFALLDELLSTASIVSRD